MPNEENDGDRDDEHHSRAPVPHDIEGEGAGLRETLLRNPHRRAIVDQLEQTPGLNKNQLARSLDVYPNLVEFHLGRLVEHGIVVVKDSPRGRERPCFLTEDEALWEPEATRILFGRNTIRSIGVYLADNPGASTGEIAEAVGLADVSVRHHLQTLRNHGLIERIRVGRSFEYRPSPVLEGWVDRLGECYEAVHDLPPEPGREDGDGSGPGDA